MKTNRLAAETSPYLRQHRTNPVDWYPWGPEALAKAASDDKPIFLSIGYSSCHWCHVMEHECFEREDVAALLNRDFISIKVDREERPDLDAFYMTATQLVTRRGGWPNSLWLTPDGRPWYAGTYFPREDQPGRAGFKTLLARLSDVWRNRRPEVEQQADQMTEAIRSQNRIAPPDAAPLHYSRLLDNAMDHFRQRFDSIHGGFGASPKFPPHTALLLLLRRWNTSPSDDAREMILHTLHAMARGGIHDQIGGGFHRYSTDEYWLLPHFEKMLYDNALLLKAYAVAARDLNEPAFARIASGIVEWLAREMTHPDGGFFSALDADSEGEEGRYYTWANAELASILSPEHLNRFAKAYSILPGGNFHDEATGRPTGLNIPHLARFADESAIAGLAPERHRLLERRNQRVRPGLDNKIITAWNALMISGLVAAARTLNRPDLIDRALQARRFIRAQMERGDKVMRSWCETTSDVEGMLDDVAALALADLDLFEVTADALHRDNALRRIRYMIAAFRDAKSGAFHLSVARDDFPLAQITDVFDQGSPSGAGLAAQALVRGGLASNDRSLFEMAEALLAAHANLASEAPSGVCTLLEAAAMLADAGFTRQEVRVYIDSDLVLRADGSGTFGFSVSTPSEWKLNGRPEIRSNALTGVEIDPHDEGAFTVRARVNISSPESSVEGTLHYQVCSETECLPPVVKSFRLKIKTDSV